MQLPKKAQSDPSLSHRVDQRLIQCNLSCSYKGASFKDVYKKDIFDPLLIKRTSHNY